jgi:hypothetical protein
MRSTAAPGNWTLTRFFAPLAIQAISQALSYPLVAMLASRGTGGALNVAGLAQAINVMFFLGMVGISLVTTGMVYAKTREGYLKFRTVTLHISLALISVQALLSLPAEKPARGEIYKCCGICPALHESRS